MQKYVCKHLLELEAFIDLNLIEQDPAPGAVIDDGLGKLAA
jgi:hypothetical protein